MDDTLFEQLLYQEESATLDFKREQYPFDGASKAEKSELLKDILAFANSWRQTTAYILIGVEEKKAARSDVVGIQNHLVSNNVQQFVIEKINRKDFKFRYIPYKFEGKDVGVIEVPQQERPIYTEVNYGKVIKEVVYIRRGDSTGIAKPDEIAKMGKEQNRSPILDVVFANLRERNVIGHDLELISKLYKVPNNSDLPIYHKNMMHHVGRIYNHNYYIDVSRYMRDHGHLTSANFAIINSGNFVATNVEVTLSIPKSMTLHAYDREIQPSFPDDTVIAMPVSHDESALEVYSHENSYTVQIKVGAIQPGATKWIEDPLIIGTKIKIEDIPVHARIVANEITPIEKELSMSFSIEKKELDVHDIVYRGDLQRS